MKRSTATKLVALILFRKQCDNPVKLEKSWTEALVPSQTLEQQMSAGVHSIDSNGQVLSGTSIGS